MYIVSSSGNLGQVVTVSASGVYNNFTGNEEADRSTALSLLREESEKALNSIGVFGGLGVITSMNESYSKNSNNASFSKTIKLIGRA